jgi:hypothetical protein
MINEMIVVLVIKCGELTNMKVDFGKGFAATATATTAISVYYC